MEDLRCTCDERFEHEAEQHLHCQQGYGTRTVSAGVHGAVANGQLGLQREGEGGGKAGYVLHADNVALRWSIVVQYCKVSIQISQQVPQAGKQQPVGHKRCTESQKDPSPTKTN